MLPLTSLIETTALPLRQTTTKPSQTYSKIVKCGRPELSVVATIAQFCEVLCCDTMMDVEHQGAGLHTGSQWNRFRGDA